MLIGDGVPRVELMALPNEKLEEWEIAARALALVPPYSRDALRMVCILTALREAREGEARAIEACEKALAPLRDALKTAMAAMVMALERGKVNLDTLQWSDKKALEDAREKAKAVGWEPPTK